MGDFHPSHPEMDHTGCPPGGHLILAQIINPYTPCIWGKRPCFAIRVSLLGRELLKERAPTTHTIAFSAKTPTAGTQHVGLKNDNPNADPRENDQDTEAFRSPTKRPEEASVPEKSGRSGQSKRKALEAVLGRDGVPTRRPLEVTLRCSLLGQLPVPPPTPRRNAIDARTTGPQTRTPSDPPGSFKRLRPEAHQIQIG